MTSVPSEKEYTFIRCRVQSATHAEFKAKCAQLQLKMEDVERALISYWLNLPEVEAKKYSESLREVK